MPKVLVVDDDPHIRNVIRFALARDGFEVADACATAASAAAPFLAAGLPLRLDGPEGAAWAGIPPEVLRAGLANLLENIRQHAGPGATGTLAWRVEEPGGRVALRVSDTGRGISAGNAGRVFDRFFTTARAGGGTGLGLPIVRSQLAAAGATIRLLRSGPGACFVLDLPPAAPAPPPSERHAWGRHGAGRGPAAPRSAAPP